MRTGGVQSFLLNVFAQNANSNGGIPCPVYILLEHSDRHSDCLMFDTSRMQSIAASFGYETCFVLPPDDPRTHDCRFRFFVSNHEMEMCGHATLGTAWLLQNIGEVVDRRQVKVQTLSGTVNVYYGNQDIDKVEIDQPEGTLSQLDYDDAFLKGVAQSLGLSQSDIVNSKSIVNASTRRIKTLVPINDRQTLHSITPNVNLINEICQEIDSTGIYAYCDSESDVVHARQFPSNTGCVEDAAAGLAELALYLRPGTHGSRLVVRQGEAMGRPSEITVIGDPISGYRVSGRVGFLPYSKLIYTNPKTSKDHLQLKPPIDSKTISDAQARILPDFKPTPLVELEPLASQLGLSRMFLKDESHRAGLSAFKVLGASWAIFNVLFERFNLDPKSTSLDDLRSVTQSSTAALHFFAATDGNHGRAVARVATKLLGCKTSVFVPDSVSKRSQEIIASEGANVHVVYADYDSTVEEVAKAASLHGDDGIIIQDCSWKGYEYIPKVIEYGYTTMFSEIDHELGRRGIEPLSLICIPVGVGSLAHAAVQYYHSSERKLPPPKIITAEPGSAACLLTSLFKQESTSVKTKNTVMPGLNCGTVSPTAFTNLSSYVDQAVAITDKQAVDALRQLRILGLSSGPCGSAPLAALKHLKDLGHPLCGVHGREQLRTSVAVMICTESNHTSQIE